MKEIRNYKESEIRAVAPETRTVEGYAVVLQEPQSYLVNPTASVTGLLPEAE